MEDQIQIVPPEGYEIDREESTLDVIRFRPTLFPNLHAGVQTGSLPKTWEDLYKINGYYLDQGSKMHETVFDGFSTSVANKNIYPSEVLAKAALALPQLLQLRDKYNDGWTPNWSDDELKLTIILYSDIWVASTAIKYSVTFVFKTGELRDTFFKNFKDNLLAEVKPLFQ